MYGSTYYAYALDNDAPVEQLHDLPRTLSRNAAVKASAFSRMMVRPKTSPGEGSQDGEPLLLVHHAPTKTTLKRVGGAFRMPGEGEGERCGRPIRGSSSNRRGKLANIILLD